MEDTLLGQPCPPCPRRHGGHGRTLEDIGGHRQELCWINSETHGKTWEDTEDIKFHGLGQKTWEDIGGHLEGIMLGLSQTSQNTE